MKLPGGVEVLRLEGKSHSWDSVVSVSPVGTPRRTVTGVGGS